MDPIENCFRMTPKFYQVPMRFFGPLISREERVICRERGYAGARKIGAIVKLLNI